jgi:hypothetical protein
MRKSRADDMVERLARSVRRKIDAGTTAVASAALAPELEPKNTQML